MGVCGEVRAVGGEVVVVVMAKEVRLEALREMEALERSTEVLVVWWEGGRKGLELVSEMVAVAEEAE